ncbi:phosphatase PAP2 family protein [Pedobacter sp. P351]|uniref:phosphatase PAP2 family protein n=1 Tax=Pedobacter superstes TaxID=3133441 RepID=UPI0030A73B4F
MKFFILTFLHFLAFQFTTFAQDTISRPPDSSKTAKSFHVSSKLIAYGAPALLLSYGFMSLENKPVQNLDIGIRHELVEGKPGFSTHWDDNLRYAPIMAVYSLNLLGIKGKNNLIDRSAIYLISNIIMSKSVDFLKDKTHKLRPSQGDFRSFPSGHTALAFGAAEFMRLEYKDKSPWFGYTAYSIAAATGAIRMVKNEHWLSDVLAGAGVGILSTKASYTLYPWLKKKIIGSKNLNFRSSPFVDHGVIGYSIIVPLN